MSNPKGNPATLKPQAHVLTVEEQSAGGKKSVEVRAKKKQFTEAVKWLANSDIKMTEGLTYEVFKKHNIDISKLDTTQLAAIGLWFGAINGNANNFKTLLETNGELLANMEINHPKIEKVEDIVDNSDLEKVLYETNKHNENDK